MLKRTKSELHFLTLFGFSWLVEKHGHGWMLKEEQKKLWKFVTVFNNCWRDDERLLVKKTTSLLVGCFSGNNKCHRAWAFRMVEVWWCCIVGKQTPATKEPLWVKILPLSPYFILSFLLLIYHPQARLCFIKVAQGYHHLSLSSLSSGRATIGDERNYTRHKARTSPLSSW